MEPKEKTETCENCDNHHGYICLKHNKCTNDDETCTDWTPKK